MTQTKTSTLEKAKRAWALAEEALSDREIERRARGFGVLVRGIAEQGSVSPSALAEALDLEPAAARDLFESFATVGVELDEHGHVIGAALTTKQTPHEIQLGSRRLYAWCAFDTLFIPGLLGVTAQIRSNCPQSGKTIRLTVSADRIEACESSGVWLSVFLPVGGRNQIGPTTPT